MSFQVKNNVHWVGKIDWELRKFHGDEYSTHKGSSYNSYLVREEKVALIDTVWTPFAKEYVENLKKKKDVCKKIESLAKEDGDHVEKFRKYQEEYNALGFVPKKNIGEIRDMYAVAVDKYIKSIEGLDEDAKEKLRIENEVSDILHSPNADQKLYRKEQSLRKQISTIENDIAVWKNNLEFFAESKKANKLKDEFQSKIDSAHDELEHLKKQLKIIRTAG